MNVPLSTIRLPWFDHWVSKRRPTTRLQQVDSAVGLAESERDRGGRASTVSSSVLEKMGLSPALLYAETSAHVRAVVERWRRNARLERAIDLANDRNEKTPARGIAILALIQLGLTPRTEIVIRRITLDHSEDDRLRVLALIFLQGATPSPPSLCATLRALLFGPESETVRIESRSWSGTIQQMAADMLYDTSGGRVVLQRAVRHPTVPYVVPWILATIRLHGSKPEEFWPLFSETVYDESNAIELRVGAVLALGVVVGDWPPESKRSGLDSLVSISLATSDDDRLRRAAKEMLIKNGR